MDRFGLLWTGPNRSGLGLYHSRNGLDRSRSRSMPKIVKRPDWTRLLNTTINACTLCAITHRLFSKAPECMLPKVCSRGPVFGILKAAHAPNHCLATLGGTGEEVVQLAIMILNRDIVYLEECVDSRAPSLLESL